MTPSFSLQNINWSEGNDTSQITGGKDGRIWQQAANPPSLQENSPNFIKRLISLCEELLVLFEEQPIDVEFAFTNSSDNPKEEKLWLLQVRPLILHESAETNDSQTKGCKLLKDRFS